MTQSCLWSQQAVMACSLKSFLAVMRTRAPFFPLITPRILQPHYSTNHQHEFVKRTNRQIDTKCQRLGARSSRSTACPSMATANLSQNGRQEQSQPSSRCHTRPRSRRSNSSWTTPMAEHSNVSDAACHGGSQPSNDTFKTHEDVLTHLERQFGNLDCISYPEPSDLKQKDDEPFDNFLVRWEHWALSFDMRERDMVADLNRRLNYWFRSSHLPNTLRELASGCRKREWDRELLSLTSLLGVGMGLVLLNSMVSDPASD